MLGAFVASLIVGCTSIGDVVAQRAEKALAKPEKKKPAPLAPIDARARKLMARTINLANPRLDKEDLLEEYSVIVDLYNDQLPRLAPDDVLVVLWAMADLTERIEALMNAAPPDWPEETWAEFRRATGCESRGRVLIELAIKYANARNIEGPMRSKLTRRLEQLDVDMDNTRFEQ